MCVREKWSEGKKDDKQREDKREGKRGRCTTALQRTSLKIMEAHPQHH